MKRAKCSKPPYDNEKKYKWTLEPGSGLENPSTVLKLIDVCAGRGAVAPCPVKAECLRDALSEQRYSVVGIWSATSGTERRRVMREVAKESFDPEAVMRWPQANRPELSTTSQLGNSSIDHALQVEEAARRLEATYRKRRRWWHARRKKVVAVNEKRRSEYAERKGT